MLNPSQDIPGREDIDEYPALYAGPNTIHIPGDNNDLPPLPIIVVGATDNYGRKIPWSQGDRCKQYLRDTFPNAADS